MAGTTLSVRFVEADGTLLRFVVDVRVTGEQPKPEPITIRRIKNSGAALAVPRLAVVERTQSGWTTVSPPKPADGTKDPLTVELSGTPEKGATFWRWQVFVETSAGHGLLHVRHASGATGSARVAEPKLNTPGAQKVVLEVGRFPRLVVGINQASVPDGTAPGGDPLLGNASDIRVLVEHVVRRLQTPKTAPVAHHRPDALEAAWDVQGARPLDVTLPANAKLAHAEEAWARQVTEMLTLTPYAGTGLTYFGTFQHDGVFLADGIDGRASGSARVYGLVHACQHLSAFGVSSRGRPAHRFGDYAKLSGLKGRRLVGAGSSASAVVTDMGGKWVIGGSPPKVIAPKFGGGGVDPAELVCDDGLQHAKVLYTIQGLEGCDFAPGALFVMANRPVKDQSKQIEKTGTGSRVEGKVEVTYKDHREVERWHIGQSGLLADNTDGAHIGFVLRTDPTVALAQGADEQRKLDEAKFQLLDTGGFGVPGRGDGVTVLNVGSGFHNGNFDGPDAARISGRVPYRGVGVWPRMTSGDAQKLDAHVEQVLKTVRPLGLARLVIHDRSKSKITPLDAMKVGTADAPWMLYASPLVPMYEADARANYSIVRYAWSLRGMPCRDAVHVMWWIYVPERPLAQAMLDAGRGDSLASIAQAAFGHVTNPLRKQKLTRKDGSLDVARLLASHTMPIIDMRVTPAGLAEVTYKYPKVNQMSWLHFAERVAWDGKIRLPMDREFLPAGQSGSGFPGYLRS